ANGRAQIWASNGPIDPFPADGTNIVRLAAGLNHLVGVRADGKPFVWNSFLPPGIEDVVDVAAGEYATMLVKRDGTLVAVNTTQPVGLTNVVSASPGYDNVAALADGRIYCWNANSSYFLEGVTNAIAVASGEWTPVALLKTGEVIQWEIHNRQPGKFGGVTNAVEVGYYRWTQVRLHRPGSSFWFGCPR